MTSVGARIITSVKMSIWLSLSIGIKNSVELKALKIQLHIPVNYLWCNVFEPMFQDDGFASCGLNKCFLALNTIAVGEIYK